MSTTGIHFTRFRDTATELYAQFKSLLKEGLSTGIEPKCGGFPGNRDPGAICGSGPAGNEILLE